MKTAEHQLITFRAMVVEVKRVAIVYLPEAASGELSSRGQVAVKGTINGVEFDIVLEPGGYWGHWFKISKHLQDLASVHVGDTVNIEIVQTKTWPEPVLADDFKRALMQAPASVHTLWYAITPMARWEWMRWIRATANADTRQRRVEVAISKLSAGKRRPCCFNLAACTDPDLSKNGRFIAASYPRLQGA